MSTSPNLLIALIAASQNNKYITANSAFDALDTAMNSGLSVAMTDADFTLTGGFGGQALSNMVFTFTGTLTATRNIILPSGSQKLYIISNQTTGGFSLTVKCGTGAKTVSLSDANYHILWCDGGNNVVEVSPSATSNSKGTWTPVASGLTQNGGSATLTGHWSQVGNLVFFTITIVPAAVSLGSTSSTAGTTSISLPSTLNPARKTVCHASDDAVSDLGDGLIVPAANASLTGEVFTPNWASDGFDVYVSGVYEIS